MATASHSGRPQGATKISEPTPASIIIQPIGLAS